ncbi:DUF748 domain-containing protein [Vibrio sp.]|uniref:DUF748 domain-containing protein n=1 Tax=Vibrio sp. TaxID=678 RepID=UPI003AA90F9E
MLSKVKTACSRFKQAPRFIRIVSYLSAAYATYALILGLIVPAVFQSQVPTTLSERLGRQVNIEKVRINPFLLRFRVDGFEIKEADDSQSFVSFERLDLQIGFWRSVLHFTPSLDHLYLQQPDVKMVRVDNLGNFNFTDIIESVANASKPTEETKETDEPSSGLPPFHARDIQLTNGQFDYIDTPTGAHLKYQGLNIRLPQLDSQAETIVKSSESQSTDSSQENHFAINVTGSDNGSLDLEGKFQFEPFAIEGKLGMNNITLSNFWPFAKKQLDAKLTNGKFNFSTEFQAQNEPTRFDYSTSKGRFELLDLNFTDGENDKIKLPSLTLDAIALTNKDHTVNIGSLTLDGLWVDALFDKKGLDLQRLFTPKQAAPQPTVSVKAADTDKSEAVESEDAVQPNVTVSKKSAQNDTVWIVRLHKFAMINNDININEKMVSNGVHWRINPFNIEANNIISDLSQPIDYDVDLEVNSWVKSPLDHTRGSFSSQGKINAKDLTFNGDINLDQLELSQFQAYIDPYLNVRLQDGKLSTKGQFSADTQGHATYAGQANITSLLVRDKLEYQPLIKWSNMTVNNLRFDLGQKSIKINSINFNSLYSKVLIDKQQRTNIGNLVKPQPTSTSKSASSNPNSRPYSVDVDSINISNGSAYFADYSLTPSFASGIESLNGSIKHLSSTPGTSASVDLKGKINKYAPVTLKGDINPLIKNPYLDLDLIFKSVELTSVNPYSGTYAGYYIDKGQLSLDLKYKLKDNNLIGENHMVIDQLKLGEPSNSDLATSLPLSLAIALLQDRNGVIDLGVQVSGDVNAPDFSFGSVLWGAFANVITKAVTSPFAMIASIAGSDAELNHIIFEPGKAIITEEEQSKLDIVAKALQERPKLKLSIVGSVQEAEDTKAIAEHKLQNILLKESGDDAIPEGLTADNFPADSDLSDALEDLFKAQFNIRIGTEEDKVEEQLKAETGKQDIDDDVLEQALNASMYNQLIDVQDVSHDELGSLAVERARAIKAYLIDVQQLEPARVFILDSKTKLKTEGRSAELSLDGS